MSGRTDSVYFTSMVDLLDNLHKDAKEDASTTGCTRLPTQAADRRRNWLLPA
jgi:hypothetical protein